MARSSHVIIIFIMLPYLGPGSPLRSHSGV